MASAYAIQYEAKQLERDHIVYNVPDLRVEEYAESICSDLRKAGLLKKKLIVVCYSMGGLVSRSMLMEAMTEDERTNVKGVLFVASPINGSKSADEIKNDLKPFIATFINFSDPTGCALHTDEFSTHFYEAGFPLSNAAKPFDGGKKGGTIADRNQAFLATGIPFRCILEQKPTFMALVGKSYFTVPHEAGTLKREGNESREEEEAIIAKGKNHW